MTSAILIQINDDNDNDDDRDDNSNDGNDNDNDEDGDGWGYNEDDDESANVLQISPHTEWHSSDKNVTNEPKKIRAHPAFFVGKKIRQTNKWTKEQNNKKTPCTTSEEKLKSFHVFRATDKLEITPSIFSI